MDIKRMWDTLLRRTWLVALLAVAGGILAGLYVVITSAPMYQANSTLFVMNRDKMEMTGQALDSSDIYFSQQLIITYGSIIQSRLVMSEAVNRLNIPGLSEAALNSVVSVGNTKESNLLNINVVWNDPQTAALICNTVSEVFAEKVNELTNSNNVDIVDKALVPDNPLPNHSIQKIFIGIVMGFMLGFGIVYVMSEFDSTVRYAGDIEDGLGLRVIGIIPQHSIK